MIDHLSVGVADLDASIRFYDAALAPLGYRRVYNVDGAAAYGREFPAFWINLPLEGTASAGNGFHVCFQARTRAAVAAFHAAALEAGATDAGAPGLRPEYGETYFGAFAYDPDGHKIEAVCYAPE